MGNLLGSGDQSIDLFELQWLDPLKYRMGARQQKGGFALRVCMSGCERIRCGSHWRCPPAGKKRTLGLDAC